MIKSLIPKSSPIKSIWGLFSLIISSELTKIDKKYLPDFDLDKVADLIPSLYLSKYLVYLSEQLNLTFFKSDTFKTIFKSCIFTSFQLSEGIFYYLDFSSLIEAPYFSFLLDTRLA